MKGKMFNSEEVRAIIAGTKTMFREVIKPQPIQLEGFSDVYFDCYSKGNSWNWYIKGNKQPLGTIAECPYRVGQKIFVKEEIAHGGYFGACFVYCADGTNSSKLWQTHWSRHFRPANYMKQEHSRITLEITDIKVERLAEISKEDAIKEGATSRPNCDGYANRYEGWCMNWNKVGEASKWASNRKTLSESDICMGFAQYAFGNFWNANHKKPEEKFEVNPFVWVVDFKINK